MSLFTDVRDAGIPHDSHEADLYVLDTPEARAILRKYPRESTGSKYFTSAIDGRRWIDVPFAYEPWWAARRLVDRDRPRRQPRNRALPGAGHWTPEGFTPEEIGWDPESLSRTPMTREYLRKIDRFLKRAGFVDPMQVMIKHHAQIDAAREAGEPASRVARRIAGMPAYPTKQRKEGRAAYAVKVERALARFGFTNSRAMIEEHHEAIAGAYKLGEPAVHVARRIAGMPAYPSSSKRGSNMANESNRAKSPARSRLGGKALPRATEVRVASLADLGVPYDPSLFYAVKGGQLRVRLRRAGKGLGSARQLGRLPGFKRGLFYFVRNGVVYARSRRK